MICLEVAAGACSELVRELGQGPRCRQLVTGLRGVGVDGAPSGAALRVRVLVIVGVQSSVCLSLVVVLVERISTFHRL